MATIKEFNKQNLKSLRQDMNAALAKLEKQYGIQINVGNASYSNNEVTFKTKCNTISVLGKALTKEAQNWGLYAELNGVGHFAIGDRVELNGQIFTIEGWNTRAKKSPVMIQDVATGATYKCTKATILRKTPIAK